jgi:hypothetical protein
MAGEFGLVDLPGSEAVVSDCGQHADTEDIGICIPSEILTSTTWPIARETPTQNPAEA